MLTLGGPTEFLSYRREPRFLFDPMRFCNFPGCLNETEFLVNDALSRIWQPRCGEHKRLLVKQAQPAGSAKKVASHQRLANHLQRENLES
jgi:hypothetical protein